MKKTILFFLLCVSFYSFSQINTQVSPLQTCDDNNDGIAVFNLQSKTSEILGNLNPSLFIVTFHETLADASLGFNSLSTNYTNITVNQMIFVRVVNSQNNAVETTQFSLIVNPISIANPATLTFCGQGNPIYNLSDATNAILNGQLAVIVQFYTTLADALNNTNLILNPSAFSATSIPQTVFSRVEDPSSGCYSLSTVILNVCTQPYIAPTNVIVSNITDNSAFISWTENNAFTNWEVELVPFGFPFINVPNYLINSNSNIQLTGLSIYNCFSIRVRSIESINNNSPWSETVSFCLVNCENNGSCPDRLDLKAFIDLNNNGTKETNEPIFNNGNFVYQVNAATPIYGNTNSGTFTIFENNPANNYNLSFAVNSNLTTYYSSNSTFSNISVPVGSGTTTYYFPITQLQAYNDLEVQIIPNTNPRPGFLYTNTIIYKNNGTQSVASGTATFTKNALVSITSITQSGTTTLPTGFSYNFTNLAPNEFRSINVTMQVPVIPTVNLNDVLTNSATISPTSGDAFPLNNTSSLAQIVVGSYDPNDKMEAHGGKIATSNFSANDYLVYTVRFENTGTANAEFIRVEDQLDSLLNAGTVEVLNASHAFNFRRINNKLIWNFYNINLPPTVTNPNLSKGFVQFKVKPNSGFGNGTVIPNSAEIYFDYNPPIYTGNFNTEFVSALQNNLFDASDFVLYPNPTSNFVQINLQNSTDKISKMVVYDMNGKIIKSISNINSNQIQMPTSEFSKGIYLIEITTQNNLKQTKKLIVK